MASARVVSVTYRQVPIGNAELRESADQQAAFLRMDAPVPVGTMLGIAGADTWSAAKVVNVRERDQVDEPRGCWILPAESSELDLRVGSEGFPDGSAGATGDTAADDPADAPDHRDSAYAPNLPEPAPVMEAEASVPIDVNEYMASLQGPGAAGRSEHGAAADATASDGDDADMDDPVDDESPASSSAGTKRRQRRRK